MTHRVLITGATGPVASSASRNVLGSIFVNPIYTGLAGKEN